MSIMMASKSHKSVKGNSVQLSTFLNYNTGNLIGHKTITKDGKEYVNFVWCKTCARHIEKIKKDSRVKGQIVKDIDSYVTGTNFVKRDSIQRHLASGTHQIGISYEKLLGPAANSDEVICLGEELTTATGTSTSKSTSGAGSQPLIGTALLHQGRDAYRKLIKSGEFDHRYRSSFIKYKCILFNMSRNKNVYENKGKC